jgi:type IV pilus assembly protein PilA
LGILAALAIPAFIGYVRRSKTSEATGNLNSLFKAAASFFSQERTARGITAETSSYCTVASEDFKPFPAANKQKYEQAVTDPSYILGFKIADYVYYGYGINDASATCGHTAESEVYTFVAYGDLDGDSALSTFELAVQVDSDMTLYHARGFYIDAEIE